MPIRKSRLSRSELTTYRAAAQELLLAGRIQQIPDEWIENADFLDIVVAGAQSSRVFELSSGGTGFEIWVRLVAKRSPITLVEFDLTTPWDKGIVLEGSRGSPPFYQIGLLWCPHAQVLNHRLEGSLRFRRNGDMVEGRILATGQEPIPQEYLTGSVTTGSLIFKDQSDGTITKNIELGVERASQWRREKRVKRSRTGLFGPGEIPTQQEEQAGENESNGEQLPVVPGDLETKGGGGHSGP